MAEVLTHNQKFDSPEAAIAHYGVKGMKWGVRNEKPSGGDRSGPSGSPQPDGEASGGFNYKKAALGAGILLGAAGAGYIGYQIHQNGGFDFRSDSRTSEKGQAFAEKTLKEPTDLIYLARGKNKGLTWHRKGNTEDFFSISEKMGMHDHGNPAEFFKKDEGSGRILARFTDPDGRTDAATRPIGHDVIVPKVMADGINNLDDVRSKIWPQIKDQYDAFYQKSLETKY